MRYTELTQIQYEFLRNLIAEQTEGRRDLPYFDSAMPTPFPTVGIGIRTDIANNVNAILHVLGIATTDPGYNTLFTAINTMHIGAAAAAAAAATAAGVPTTPDQILEARWNAAFNTYYGDPAGTQQRLTDDEMDAIKNLVYREHEDAVTNIVEIGADQGAGTVQFYDYDNNQLNPNPRDDGGEIPYSVERATFADAQFNGISLINWRDLNRNGTVDAGETENSSLLEGAINESIAGLSSLTLYPNATPNNIEISDAYSRAIGYFELGFNSNGGGTRSTGIAKRRAVEVANMKLYHEDAVAEDYATMAQFYNNLASYRGAAYNIIDRINDEAALSPFQLADGDIMAINNRITAYNAEQLLLDPDYEAIPLLEAVWRDASMINNNYNLGETINANGSNWTGTLFALYTKWKAVLQVQDELMEIGLEVSDYPALDANLEIEFTHYQNDGNLSAAGSTVSHYLFGGRGSNVLTGGEGNDVIYGFRGDDTLIGNGGNDILNGGHGENTLRGGSGDDIFIIDVISGDFDIDGGINDNDVIIFGADLLASLTSNGTSITYDDGNNNYTLDYINIAEFRVEGVGPITIQGLIAAINSGGISDAIDAISSTVSQIEALITNQIRFGDFGLFQDMNKVSNIFAQSSGDVIVTPEPIDIKPILLFLLQATGDEILFEVDLPFGESFEFTLNDLLDQIDFPTVDRHVIDFGPGISPDEVTREQVGNDLVMTITNDDGSTNTLTVLGIYTDGNDDEIVSVNFADGTQLDLADIDVTDPPPPPIIGTSGNDVLSGTTGNDVISGLAGNDRVIGSEGADEIDGGAGIDTVDYRSSTAGVTVDLASGTGSGGHAQGDSYTAVERAYGSQYADVMTGDSGNNLFYTYGGNDVINAGAGNDYVRGGAGADQMDGGAGNDYLDYRGSTSGVNVNLATGAASGGDAQGDTFSNFEHILGSHSNDMLTGDNANNLIYGNNGNDVINGGGGNDYIRGGDGADLLDGGSGRDSLVYRSSTSGVTVNLLTGTASGGYAEGDVFSNFEQVLGSNHADNITGDHQNNTLLGYDGNDQLTGNGGNDVLVGGNGNDHLFGGDGTDYLRGDAGADVLNGGNDFDYADYRYHTTGVTANLANAAANSGAAAGDSYISVEGLLGHLTLADTLIGNSANNRLYGYGGDDVLSGGAGDDVLRGGTGADVLNGGSGLDSADYRTSSSGVTVNLSEQTGSGGEAEGDTLISIERVNGSNHADVLTGNNDVNYLYGYNGNDTISGGLGGDYIRGGNGNDTIVLIGADTAYGDAGNDTFLLAFNAFDGAVIHDFADGDIINLTAVVADGEFGGVTSLSVLLSYASQVGNHVVLDFGDAAVTLQNTSLASLTADDFIFGQGNPIDPDPFDPFDPFDPNDPDYFSSEKKQ